MSLALSQTLHGWYLAVLLAWFVARNSVSWALSTHMQVMMRRNHCTYFVASLKSTQLPMRIATTWVDLKRIYVRTYVDSVCISPWLPWSHVKLPIPGTADMISCLWNTHTSSNCYMGCRHTYLNIYISIHIYEVHAC